MKTLKARNFAHAAGTSETRGPKQYDLPEIMIGTDVLELISSAMYIDPITVYREYIQNVADAVDEARSAGALSDAEVGRVDISFDQSTRTVRIRDNGCGIPFEHFGRKLTAIGSSEKRGTQARGFRGIGRLAGLAYARQLIFKSRVPGECDVSQLTWDCRRLKSALQDGADRTGLASIVRKVTTLERIQADDAPERFFEVEMRGVVRLRNDRLMSPLAVADYLSQVAPVPFSPAFKFCSKLSSTVSRYGNLGELDIRINSAEGPIYRPHRDRMVSGQRGSINFDDVEIVEIPCIDDGVAAVGWILHHEYAGAIPNAALVKGLRLRLGNIQVGGHALLEEVFSESRFNSWTVGEVHVFDERIVPNGRRDHFEQNVHFYNLVNHLAPTARHIARLCRTSSVRRKWEREYELCVRSASETIDIIVQGSMGHSKKRQLALSVEQTLLRMSKIAGKCSLADSTLAREEVIEILRDTLCKAMNDDFPIASPLSRLPEARRKAYEHFFELVYECSSNRISAKALIDRMLLRLE